MRTLTPFALSLSLGLVFVSCKDEEKPPEKAEQGDSCDPDEVDEDGEGPCAEGLSCEPVNSGDGYVCGTALEIRGQVIDALDESAIEGALVAALDETGAPVTDVAVTDADGRYTLSVSAVRDENGEIADSLRWTMTCSADDYVIFPAGVRPAIPVNAQDAQDETEAGDTDGGDVVTKFIENASTTIALIPLPDDQAGGATISGTAGEAGAGALVVAEGVGMPAPRTVADASGAFTLFNVPAGDAQIRAYRVGVEFETATVTVADGDAEEGVELTLVTDNADDLAHVTGSINIVNAPGGSMSSVVLVPSSVYNDLLERGPVPFGLRAPEPPEAPSIDGAFDMAGVPAGTYKVLAAFENDDLVRDPDESIAGTAIPEITVMSGQDFAVDTGFKVTEHLAVVSPGKDAPERVLDAPTFIFADDSSEDRYHVVVFDALGNLVWEDDQIPGVSGSDTVEVPYGGPALEQGMYYQFRATSWKDTGGMSAISRTEDLRGVFVFGEEPAGDTGGTGG